MKQSVKNLDFDQKVKWVLAAFVVLNVLIFVFANNRPMEWLHDEILNYRFYWAMDGVEQLTLHTGIRPNDFLKSFVCRYTVGAFRPRQISNLFEMLSYKATQWFTGDYLRDYFLIFLHLGNVALFWLLIRKLFGNVVLAWMAAAMMLNSGAALATLFFPFRLAKVLVLTFFLLNFILIVSNPPRFDRAKIHAHVSFLIIFICAFFSDETFVFLIPLYLFFIGLFQGRQALLSQKFRQYGLTIILFLVILGTGFYFYSRSYDAPLHWHQDYFKQWTTYFVNPSTYRDIGVSFLRFIQRNFGYWELSVTGLISFVAFAGLLYFALINKPQARQRIFALVLPASLLIKTLLMPHINVHPYIMPVSAGFPSMLYFNYYYVYVDSFLMVFCYIVWISSIPWSARKVLIVLTCVTLINFANMINVRRGIADSLKFHALDSAERIEIIRDVSLIKGIINKHQNQPVYLSFPSGNKRLVDGRFGFDSTWPIYAAYVLTMFLPSLESGDAIISLDNVNRPVRGEPRGELSESKIFYDVARRESLELNKIRAVYDPDQWKPKMIRSERSVHIPCESFKERKGDYLFFVKGEADVVLQIGEQKIPMKQYYGESYQLFSVNIQKDDILKEIAISLDIHPKHVRSSVSLIGPFLIKNK